MHKLTIEICKDRLKNINPNIKIISTEYIKSSEKLQCQCIKDGYIWGVTWNDLNSGYGCPKCGGTIKYTLEEIILKIKEINPLIKVMSSVYKDAHGKLTVECLAEDCGHIWDISWHNINNGRGCPKCSGKLKWDIDRIKDKLKEFNKSITLLSKEYHGPNTILKFKCEYHNYIWDSKWSRVLQTKQCQICSIESRSGENHYNYNPELSDIERVKNKSRGSNSGYKKFRTQVLQMYNNTCVCCGILSYKNMRVHHLNGWHWDDDSRYNIDNAVVLCPKCHDIQYSGSFHNIYRNKNNTIEQFKEFYMEKTLNEWDAVKKVITIKS